MLTEGELCQICSAPHRDASLVCVVESPSDVVAIEHSGSYKFADHVYRNEPSGRFGIGRALDAVLLRMRGGNCWSSSRSGWMRVESTSS